jgi:phosphoribosylanthranilate isomerase
MALSTTVKISVNNLSDARYAAGMGVNMIGFCLDKNSSDYVDTQKFSAIAQWITGVELVGEITNATTDWQNYALDALQVNDWQLIDQLQTDLPLLLSLNIDNYTTISFIDEILEKYVNKVKYFILESNTTAQDKTEWLQKVCSKYPILLGVAMNESNLATVLALKATGISLKGGNEISAGLKDFDELSGVLELLEEEN